MELKYLKQTGLGAELDMDVISYKAEFNSNFRELFITAGVEVFGRIYTSEQTKYYNVYVKLVRTFDWKKR